jgi:hypothetical protein
MTQARYGPLLLLISVSPFTHGATLKQETVAAWDSYLEHATAAMQARLQPGAKFLWLEEEPGRMEFVRTKGPLIGPAGKHIPQKVSNGLIHDWIGAGFIPNARIEDILRVVRDYDSYNRIYRPGVIDSLSRGHEGEKDLFFLRLANRSVVSKTALDAECEARYIRVDDHRWYGYSNTIRINELAHFGTPQQVKLSEDMGTGLIWRLSSITRLEERDGGVYAELEALALSRDIPSALRLFVTPIVRRVSRDSLATSLHQTKLAIDDQLAHHEQVNPAQ